MEWEVIAQTNTGRILTFDVLNEWTGAALLRDLQHRNTIASGALWHGPEQVESFMHVREDQ